MDPARNPQHLVVPSANGFHIRDGIARGVLLVPTGQRVQVPVDDVRAKLRGD